MYQLLRLSAVLFLLIVMFTALVPLSSPVYADSCPIDDPTIGMAARVADAPIVIEGIITDTEAQSGQQIALVDVSAYFKGSGPEAIIVTDFEQEESCLQSDSVDSESLLLFISEDAGNYYAYYGDSNYAALQMTDSVRQDVINLARPFVEKDNSLSLQNPTPVGAQATTVAPTALPTEPVATGTQEDAADDDDDDNVDLLPIIAGVIVVVVLLGVGLVIASRRSTPLE